MDERAICAGLMASGGLLLALRLRPSLARVAWLILLAAGLANALALSLAAGNLVNNNVAHYYLGAKHSFPYSACYKLINAAVERPQVAMRDLERPPAMRREDPREQRAYYIDLMREFGVEVNPLVPLPELRRRAKEAGVVQREAERILSDYLPAEQVEGFRLDVRRALWDEEAERNIREQGRDITWDYGYNGSPLYSLVRHLDPTLYRPFGRGTAWLNLAWQTVAALLLVWILGMALDEDMNGRLAMAALLFASWDFVAWSLPGLIFAGLWLPVALALLAMRLRWGGLAGVAIAWAGLIKLFPLVLALPAAARLARRILRRRPGGESHEASRFCLRLLVSCALAVPLLGLVSMLSGRSWWEFLHKIVVQFQSKGYIINSVSLSQGLLTLGRYGSESLLPGILSLVALATVTVMFLRSGDEGFMDSLPRRSLVLLAATGWLIHTWFNYYAVAPLLLLPLVARRHRLGAAVAAVGMAVAFLLPEFDDPRLILPAHPVVHGLKVAPYVLIPAWLVALEFWGMRRLGKAWRTAVVAVAVLCTAAVVGEAWRLRAIRRLDDAAGAYLDSGDAQSALVRYRRLVMIAPHNAMAHMNEAIALANLGRSREAAAGFARARTLAPESLQARQNYGRWLLGAGKLEEAAAEMESARSLAPHHDGILSDLARIRLRQGRLPEARALLTRAQELHPGNRAVVDLLKRLRTGGPEAP
jgi:Tfp pilus assembly protein PilF